MAASPLEQINAQALASFRTVEFPIGNAKIVLRELSPSEYHALQVSLFETDDKGEFIQKPDPKDGELYMVPLPGVDHGQAWLLATLVPVPTAEMLKAWPVSLKRQLLEEAKKVNNLIPAAELAKN